MSKILVLGGGFAGMWAALAAARENILEDGDLSISLLSPDPYLTIRPRLYEARPEDLRTPLEPVLSALDIEYIQGSAEDIDAEQNIVTISDGSGGERQITYDKLILATGSVLRAPPIPGLAEYSFNIDDFASATNFDRHLAETAQKTNNYIILGAGFTGIELATEMRRRIAVHNNQDIADASRIILVDRADHVGPDLGANPRPIIEEALLGARVETRLGTTLERVDATGVELRGGEYIKAAAVICTTGQIASPLTEKLDADRDQVGRLHVDEMLRVTPEVFATGDVAHAMVDEEHTALMSCQHALRMGRFAGYNAARDLLGLPLRPYRQERYVTCLDLGSEGAVFTSGWDRQVQYAGEEADQMKRQINEIRIYPPTDGRDALLEAAEIVG